MNIARFSAETEGVDQQLYFARGEMDAEIIRMKYLVTCVVSKTFPGF